MKSSDKKSNSLHDRMISFKIIMLKGAFQNKYKQRKKEKERCAYNKC